MSRSMKAHILLILVTLVWGATFVQIKDALRDISPLLFNAVRMTLAATVLSLLYWKQMKRITPAALRSGLLVGTMLGLGYAFQTTGLNLTTPSKSAFLTSLAVVLVPVFMALFWRKTVNRWTALGVVAAFAGLYLLTVPTGSAAGSFGDFSNINLGDIITVGCSVAFAFHIIFLGKATRVYAFQQIAVLQTAVAAVLMYASAPLIEHPHALWSQRVLLAILVTGLLGTAAAFTIQAWAQQFLAPTNTALIFALEPVFAWITSYLALGERLGVRAAAGAGLILCGLLASELLGNPEAKQAALA
jgi:drug/metabolite transporter (DMT)-like permease